MITLSCIPVLRISFFSEFQAPPILKKATIICGKYLEHKKTLIVMLRKSKSGSVKVLLAMCAPQNTQ